MILVTTNHSCLRVGYHTISLSFSVVGKEAGRRWEIVREDVGCVGATTNFIT
jgi:hypothetical protein